MPCLRLKNCNISFQMPEVEFGRAICESLVTSGIEVVSACSSSTSAVQENMLYRNNQCKYNICLAILLKSKVH